MNVNSEEMTEITILEIESTFKKMKNGRASGEDYITYEML